MHKRSAIFILLTLFFLLACDRKQQPAPASTPTPAPATPKPKPSPTATPAPTPKPEPTPPPTPYVPMKSLQTGAIFNGITFKANIETLPGGTATAERESSGSYTVEMNLRVNIPKPHKQLSELQKLSPQIEKLLPTLPLLLESAKVSKEYDELYRTKVTSLRSNLNRLDTLLSRHNFFDCETILELQHPKTKRKALLIQADMDVDTDGSDGDRIAIADTGNSRTFQPFTSYNWAKRTKNPNPVEAIWQKRIADNDAKFAKSDTSDAEQQRLRAENSKLKSDIKSLQSRSYLSGAFDPFIVLPLTMVGRPDAAFTPSIGDYCVIIVEGVLYPAILGDAGPTTKIGEASLRICRQINERSNGGNRPINNLEATYIVFPGTGEKPWGPPDYVKWRTSCEVLLNEFGGYTGTLFDWPDISKSAVPEPLVPQPTPAAVPAVPAQPAGAKPENTPPAAKKNP